MAQNSSDNVNQPLPPPRRQPTAPMAEQVEPVIAEDISGGDASAKPATLGSRIKAAGQLAARQAEKTKLTSLTLPSAYKALGKHVYKDGGYRNEFADLFEQLDQAFSEIEMIKQEAANRPHAETIGAKAKAATEATKDLAKRKNLEHRINQLLTKLGEDVFSIHGEQSGPQEVVQPIITAHSQIEELEKNIAHLTSAVKEGGAAPIFEHTAIIALSMLMCFPIGLFLVWRNSRWSQKHKLIWTGAVAGVFVVLMVASSLIHNYVARNFAEANQLWEAGQRAEAVEKYRPMLKRDLDFLNESEKPTVFQRVIEYEVENGNDDEATRIIELAKTKKIPISLESPRALTLLTKIEEKQKEAARLAAQKRQSEEKLAAQKRRSREKLPAFEAIASKLESFPDRLAGVTERRKFNDELRKLVDDFGDIPFDAVQYSDDARQIVELYEEKVENRYQGHTFDILDAHVREIIQELLSR